MLKRVDEPRQVLRTSGAGLAAVTAHNTRLPAGHPEGFLEAFANVYRNFADCLGARLESLEPPAEALDFPDVHDGVRGMRFIEAVVRSAANDSEKWTKV